MLFEFVKPLVGAKSVQFANGPSGRAVHKTMAAAFSHQACADALPKGASTYDVLNNFGLFTCGYQDAGLGTVGSLLLNLL